MNRFNAITDKIEQRLNELTDFSPSSYSVLCEAEKYSLTNGGKHLRGLILIQTALLGNADIDSVIDYACALEMVHSYSLIHDDLPEMDNDDFRRGVPTCHKKYGADIALLAGDAILTKAFSVIAENNCFSDSVKIKCISVLADACGEHGMLAGQTIDKISENKQIDFETLLELHARKTGDMFLAAVKLGCILGGLDNGLQAKLENYIVHMGLAFQIKDDILDVTSTSQQLGKPVKSDESSLKSTFVSMIGLDKSEEFLLKEIECAKSFAKDINNDFYLALADLFLNRTK